MQYVSALELLQKSKIDHCKMIQRQQSQFNKPQKNKRHRKGSAKHVFKNNLF